MIAQDKIQVEIYRRDNQHAAQIPDVAYAVLTLESVGLTLTLAELYD